MHCELPEGNNRRAYNTQIIDFVKFAVFVGSLSDGFLVYFFFIISGIRPQCLHQI